MSWTSLGGGWRRPATRKIAFALMVAVFLIPTVASAQAANFYHLATKPSFSWTKGALNNTNSDYFETDVVPHYVEISRITVGNSYTFQIYYDYYYASTNTCGFDHLATYDQTRQGFPTPGAPLQIDDPIPGGYGNFYTSGANITQVSGPFDVGDGVQRYLEVTFTALATTAYLYWGLYIAPPDTIPGCRGASQWPGASLQTSLTGVTGGGTLSIMTTAIARAMISGYKWEDKDSDRVWDGDESALSGWTVQLCADSACSTVIASTTTAADGSYTLYAYPGTHYIREVQQAYWTQTYPVVGYHQVTVSAGGTYSAYNFGNHHDLVDLATTKTSSVTSVQWDCSSGPCVPLPFYYDITVTNYGPDSLTSTSPGQPAALVTDGLPANLTVDPDHALPAGCTYSGTPGTTYGGLVTCEIAALGVGSGNSITFRIWVRLHPDDPGTGVLQNTACVAPTPQAKQEEPNRANNCGSVSVTAPVTLAFFQASREDGHVRFDWQTATEELNAGFNLYVEANRQPRRLNAEIIPSKVVNSAVPQEYSFRVAGVAGEIFYLEDVDTQGRTRLHGPFALGQTYGGRLWIEPTNWSAVWAEHERKSLQRAAVERRRLAAVTVARKAVSGLLGYPACEFLVETDGVYRVTNEMLQAAGLDLTGVPRSLLALSNRGRPVPLRFGGPELMGPGSFLEFYGVRLNTLYSHTNVYRLEVAGPGAKRMDRDAAKPGRSVTIPTYYLETSQVNRDRDYADVSPNGDPWYDTMLLVYRQPKTWDGFTIEVDHLVPEGEPPVLRVELWGLSDMLPGPDHHVQIALNGTPVADVVFDAFEVEVVEVTLPRGLVHDGTNTMAIALPADRGAKWDMLALDRYSLTYPRAFVARDGRLMFTGVGSAFRVTNLPSPDVAVYRLVDGQPTFLASPTVAAAGGSYSVTFRGSPDRASYVLASGPGFLAPRINSVRPIVDLTSGVAQYLIVSHPDFIDGLAPLVAARQAQGFTVKIVDVRDVYNQFGDGIFGPEPLRDYIRYASRNMGTEYVLLVGDDTYDYLGTPGHGGISFLPTPFVPSDRTLFLPADPWYADVDDDGVPDLAVGRLPVRTSAELANLVEKMRAYETKTYRRRAVFAADRSFRDTSEIMRAGLPEDWTCQRVHLDELTVSQAQTALQESVNSGMALTNYVGHSSSAVWSFNYLLTSEQAKLLTNFGKPTVVTQWGCYNTYYLQPKFDTLNDLLLLGGTNAAVATMGPTSLATESAERALAVRLMPKLARPGMTIGAAIRDAKRELARELPGLIDVQMGWTLLGDPALVVEPGRP